MELANYHVLDTFSLAEKVTLGDELICRHVASMEAMFTPAAIVLDYKLLISLKGLTLSMASHKLESLDLFNVALRTSLKCYFCPYLEQTLIELGKIKPLRENLLIHVLNFIICHILISHVPKSEIVFGLLWFCF